MPVGSNDGQICCWPFVVLQMTCGTYVMRSQQVPLVLTNTSVAWALRHLVKGDYANAAAVVKRAPHWHLTGRCTYKALEQGLINIISKAHVALLDAHAILADDLPPAQARLQKDFVCKLLRICLLYTSPSPRDRG
eukprot:4905558-Amphidinium_carterae.1